MKYYNNILLFGIAIRVFIGLLWCIGTVQAQDIGLNNFSALKSEGLIPEHFTTLSLDKYEEQSKKQTNREADQFDMKNQKDFYRMSNFWIDELMLSGKIVFNDPVSDYINEVADRLLKNEPALRKELKFYTAKSPVYNASSTDQGIIFVNTGLISRLNSEAQLAFVLSHEIAHYVKKHNMNNYLQNQRIIHSKGLYKGVDMEDKILNINHMSKDDEFQADEIGYERFYKGSGYKLAEIDTLFHYMLISECPFFEEEFNVGFFEDEYYKFPKKYHTDSLKAINFDKLRKNEEDTDDKTTITLHPATQKRLLVLRRMKLTENDSDNRLFIVSEDRFNYVKSICQFESIRQQMLSGDYLDAVYNTYVLQKYFPDNSFLEMSMASALYQISHLKTHNENSIRKNDYYSNPATEQGVEIQKVQFLFDKLNGAESTVLALRYLSKVISKYGSTSYTSALLEDLLSDLFIVNKYKLKEFLKADELAANISLNDPNAKNNDLYYLNAFAYELDPGIYQSMKEWDERRAAVVKEEEVFENLSYKEKAKIRKEKKDEENKREHRVKYQGASLDIDKVVIVDPRYYKLDSRKKGMIDLRQSELHRLRYNERIQECVKASDLNVDLLSSKGLKTSETERFNNMALLNEWLQERAEFDLEYDFVPYSTIYIERLSEDYKTDYFLWTGVFSERKNKDVLLAVGASLLFTYGLTLPFVIAWAVIPNYKVYYYSLLFDIKTGEKQLIVFDDYKGSDLSGDFVKSSLYDTFNQISKENK
jgi:beta-barrel assembly-enhancing protease